ncbi:MAG: hypothetical protein WCF23_17935 [Candidatus Nitrosopolaris sp.]
MEEQLEHIESGKAKSSLVICYAINKIKEAVVPLKEKVTEIDRQITDAVVSTQNKHQQRVLGNCPMCSKGVLKNHKIECNKKKICRMF